MDNLDKRMYKQFYTQKWNAENKRDIKWELTFEEWKTIWLDSGFYDQRGIYGGNYNMCRYNDEGPYSKDNVRIDTMENNIKEAKPLVKQGSINRWAKDGEREKHSLTMSDYWKTDEGKEVIKNRVQTTEGRKANADAIRNSRAKPLRVTNIESGETFTLIGEKQIKEYGFSPSLVSQCANGKVKSHKGHLFEFINKY